MPHLPTAALALLLAPFALLVAFVSGRWGPLHDTDAAIAAAVHDWALRNPLAVDAMAAWSLVFSPVALRVAALALVIWLFRRRLNRVAWWVIVTMTAGGLLVAGLKLLLERDRPDLFEPVARAAGYSFPSGHAANAALACGVFLLVLLPYRRARPWLWAGAVLVTVVTGLTRIGLGVHWSSDVLAGWLLGTAMVIATAAAFRPERPRPAPAAEAGLEPGVTAVRG